MKFVRYLAPAVIVSGMALSPALAAPASGLPGLDQASAAPVIHVQYHGHDNHRGHGRYVAGRRYRSAPHGWHRFNRRPGDWRARNCVMVGPLWFCP